MLRSHSPSNLPERGGALSFAQQVKLVTPEFQALISSCVAHGRPVADRAPVLADALAAAAEELRSARRQAENRAAAASLLGLGL